MKEEVQVELSVCILTRNQPDLLRRSVASCLAEIERTGVSSEILIIDNASSDGSPETVAKLSSTVRIIRNEENLGFAAANNKGIRLSQGRYVLILNDDAALRQGSLRLMFCTLNSDPQIAMVGPKLLNRDGTPQTNYTNRRFPRSRGLLCGYLGLEQLLERRPLTRDLFTHTRDPELSGEAEYVAGACMLARRAALDEVGLFDEGFYYWFEDTDLCYRLKKAGWKIVYLADAEVDHYGGATAREMTRSEITAISSRSKMYFFRKHSSPGRYLFLRVTAVAALLLRMPVLVLLRIGRRGTARKELDEWVRASRQSLRTLLTGEHP